LFQLTLPVMLFIPVFLASLRLAEIPELTNYQEMVTDKVTGNPMTDPEPP